ncbi:MAG TPA: hypothetical protein DCM62_02830 [Bacteroidales bacterium]|nr:hypothetical protein [Bacteroidales bacterium]
MVMDELGLAAESIQVKIKKLLFLNRQLSERIKVLSVEKQALQDKLSANELQTADLEQRVASLRVATYLKKDDSEKAKQVVAEMLREIEKCFALLNR